MKLKSAVALITVAMSLSCSGGDDNAETNNTETNNAATNNTATNNTATNNTATNNTATNNTATNNTATNNTTTNNTPTNNATGLPPLPDTICDPGAEDCITMIVNDETFEQMDNISLALTALQGDYTGPQGNRNFSMRFDRTAGTYDCDDGAAEPAFTKSMDQKSYAAGLGGGLCRYEIVDVSPRLRGKFAVLPIDVITLSSDGSPELSGSFDVANP